MKNTFLKSNYLNKLILLIPILLSVNTSLFSQYFNGTLRLNTENPRYFTDKSGKSIYLTGSHTWANFQEAGLATDSLFEWKKYLEMMRTNHHNFMKLWIWEQAKLGSWSKEALVFYPLPYQEITQNGKVKYDLSKWNDQYFERLRKRVIEAGQQGIYVSIMLFQGWSMKKEKIESGNPWLFHPFNPDNNINGVGRQIVDNKEDDAEKGTLHSLKNGDVMQQQEAYVKKVVETVNDLDNVLFEIINEGGTRDWQYHIINFVKKTEQKLTKQHPVGMSHAIGVSPLMWNQELFESPADWVAPTNEPVGSNYRNSSLITDYQVKIQPNSGKKVTILDTDHLWGCGGNYQWVWKSFLQGYCPIFMDSWQNFPYPDTVAISWLSPCLVPREYTPYKLIRQNMGVTMQYSKRIDLGRSTPQPDLCSSGFCLAQPNKSYMAWLESKPYLTINLRNTDGIFEVEWFNPLPLETKNETSIKGGDYIVLKSPFTGESVVFLRKK